MKTNKTTIAIISILAVLVLLLGGYIVYDKVLKEEPNNQNDVGNKNEESTNNNEQNNQNINENNNSDNFKLNNEGISKKDLNEVLDMLGLKEYNNKENHNEDNECLNYYVSKQDFRNNSKEIFVWYLSVHNMGTYHEDAMIYVDKDNKIEVSVYNCADCGSTTIKNAEKIIGLYKLTGMDKHFGEMPEPYKNTEYTINYFDLSGKHPLMCNIKTSHDIVAKYDNNNNIIITDIQNVTEYEEYYDKIEENITNTKNQTVTYEFKKDTTGSYYLSNVEVK